MKKAVLIIAIIITVSCFSWYIIEPGRADGWIGHQSDDALLQTISADTTPSHSASAKASSAAALQAHSVMNSVLSETESATTAPLDPIGWDLVWSDEFDAPLLNLEYWTEVDRRNNFNEELQYYLPGNSSIEDGCLTLTAKQENVDGRSYTSGMVETRDKLDILYGRIEARISLPVSQGIFPAFWMLTDSGYHELDILEMVGNEPGTIYAVCHYIEYRRWKAYGYTTVADPEEFHVYAIEWDKDEVRWYVDGVQYFSTRNNVPDEPMYLIFTLAVGGVWPGDPDATTQFPLSMKVDYVRIYTRETEGEPHDLA